MLRERFQRAALVGLVSIPGFFGCARPEQAQVQESQAIAVAKQAVEGLVNQNPQPFIQAMAPGNNIPIGPQEMLAMRKCQGVPANYTEEQAQGQQGKKIVKVDFAQTCINTGAAITNALDLVLENRNGKWGLIDIKTAVPRGASVPQETQRGQERTAESSFKPYTSLNFPYRIDIPSIWTTSTSTAWIPGSTVADRFFGERGLVGMRITNAPIADHVKVKDYTQQRTTSLMQTLQLRQVNGAQYQLAGIQAEEINYIIPQPQVIRSPDLNFLGVPNDKSYTLWEVFMIKDKKLWYVQFISESSIAQTQEQNFRKILQSFKFLS